MDEENLRDLENKHVIYGWQQQNIRTPTVFERTERVYLWDRSGKRYVDFCSGQINVNAGYSHPKILDAMARQMEKMTYVAPNFSTEARIVLSSLVAKYAPGDLEYVFFTNSGAEAIENAIKIARAVTGRSKIYSALPSYHGATAGAAAISGDPRRSYAEPVMPGVARFHYPNCYRCPFGQTSLPNCGLACFHNLQNQILLDGPETVAAIVLEPIVGTSGLYVPPIEFVQNIRTFTKEYGILLIFDETMSGWGRSGRWFASEHFDVIPDIMTTAKGISSAYVPLGAVVVPERIRDHFLNKGFVGGLTTEAHTLACAAAIANIKIYEEEKLIEKSASLGEHLLQKLHELKKKHPSVGDVRGRGLFSCIELTANRSLRKPLAGYRNSIQNVSAEITRRLFENGLLTIAKWDFIFIAPPLVITKDELDEGLHEIDRVLDCTDQLIDVVESRA